MKVNRPRKQGNYGRYAGIESRFLQAHVWQGTYAGWTFAFRIGGGRLRLSGSRSWGQPW